MRQFSKTHNHSSRWAYVNPILDAAKIGYETDTAKYKIGNGTSHWNELPYSINEDAVQALVSDGAGGPSFETVTVPDWDGSDGLYKEIIGVTDAQRVVLEPNDIWNDNEDFPLWEVTENGNLRILHTGQYMLYSYLGCESPGVTGQVQGAWYKLTDDADPATSHVFYEHHLDVGASGNWDSTTQANLSLQGMSSYPYGVLILEYPKALVQDTLLTFTIAAYFTGGVPADPGMDFEIRPILLFP